MTEQRQISFARGAPSLDIVAVDDLRAAAARALESDPAGAFMYGTSAGYGPLVEWIAERHGVEQEQVIATNGSLPADFLLFDHVLDRGARVVVEAPTYDRTLLGLRERGMNLEPVPMEEDGLDIQALERALDDGPAPKLAHVIPNFHNPAGATLSLDKRRRLLELAREHDFWVFEDDPYVELRFDGQDLPTMLSLAGGTGCVVYASSFSKTVCPGIRVGYLVGPSKLIEEIRTMATNAYISPSMVSQAIVAEFCRSGGMEHSVENAKQALRERRDRLAAALERELPDAEFDPPEGGYFMWVELPEGADVSALAAEAKERGVALIEGTDFLIEGGENAMRLSFSGVTPDEIDEGVGRLAAAYRELAGATA